MLEALIKLKPFGVGLKGIYTPLAALPIKIYSSLLVELDKTLYLIGGRTDQGDGPTIPNTYRYDLDKNQWTRLQDLPAGLYQMGSAQYEQYIFVVGGVDNTAENSTQNTLYRFDPSLNRWDVLALMPEARNWPGVAQIGDFLYAFGGVDKNQTYQNTLFRYDILNDQWTTIVPNDTFPSARGYTTPLVIGQSFYIVGGYNKGVVHKELWRYDSSTNTWTQLADAPHPMYGQAAALIDGKLYYFGGWLGNDRVNNPMLFEYSPLTDSWVIVTEQGQGGFIGAFGCACNGIAFIGGGRKEADYKSATNEFWRID